jgi:hypothetical protein
MVGVGMPGTKDTQSLSNRRLRSNQSEKENLDQSGFLNSSGQMKIVFPCMTEMHVAT